MERTRLTVTDAVAGVPVVVLAVVATVSLAWAHLGHHSLPAVLLTSAVLLAPLALLRVTGDRNGLAVTLGCGALAAVMFFPGFPYGVGDKDPGNYVAHAVQIAREGSYDLTDPALAHPTLPVEWENEKARVPAMWVEDAETGRIVPQFFHLWPALQATAYDVGGYGGIVGLTPLVAMVAVMAFVALLRRIAGVVAAGIAGALLATNMLVVWQAKYPSTESFAMTLYLGALLAAVVAAQQRSRAAAFVAGALVGVGFLNRADAWLLVMLAAAGLGAVWASRRGDAEALYGGAGLAVVLPYALWQAYDAAVRYTRDNDVPGLVPTLVLLAVVGAVATAARRLDWGWVARRQRVLGLALCAACLALLVAGFLRPLAGEAHLTFAGRVTRSWDERNLHRLAWFLTLPAFALAGLGVAVLALRRWRTSAWLLLVPTLALTLLYGYQARVAVRLMWWGRRYVPHVVPGLLALVAIALAFAVFWEWRGRRPLRVPALIAAAALAATYAGQSLPLRGHQEWQGSLTVAERLSDLSGDRQGVYLWRRGPCCAAPSLLWSGPVWLARDEVSVLLPETGVTEYVAAYRKAFDPVFVVWDTTSPPDPTWQQVERLTGAMPFWTESESERPTKPRTIRYDFTVYRVP